MEAPQVHINKNNKFLIPKLYDRPRILNRVIVIGHMYPYVPFCLAQNHTLKSQSLHYPFHYFC